MSHVPSDEGGVIIDAHQANSKPLVWTQTADEILASIAQLAQRTFDARAAQLSRHEPLGPPNDGSYVFS